MLQDTKYYILNALNIAVESVLNTFNIDIKMVEDEYNKLENIEEKIKKYTERRNELLRELEEIREKIYDLNVQIDVLTKNIKDKVLKNDELVESINEIINEYNRVSVGLNIDEVKLKYPTLYKFVAVFNRIRYITTPEKMYIVIEGGSTRTREALIYYLVTNYRNAQRGSSERITITEAANKFGIRPSTLSAKIAELMKKGKIVKIYDPLTKRYEYEISDAVNKVSEGNKTVYYRDLGLNINTYKSLIINMFSRK